MEEVQNSWTAETDEGAAAALDAAGLLKVAAIAGILAWYVDNCKGAGRCDKTGSGTFKGKEIPPSITGGGKYKLTLTRITAKLELFDNDGKLVHTYYGKGLQKGLSGTWEGTWS